METPENSNQKEFLNNKEAASFLGVSTITLYRFRREGIIDFYRFGTGKVFYRRNELENFIEKKKRAAFAA